LETPRDFVASTVSKAGAGGGIDIDAGFEAIFLEHYARVLGIALRFTGSRAQAEELANDVFWRLSRKRPSWLLANNVAGWLYRTATHAAIDALRASRHRMRYEGAAARSTEVSDAGPLSGILREEDRTRVQHVLSTMKPLQAQILIMRAGDSSYREIAEALGVSPGSVGTLLNRAEEAFRKRYLKLNGKREEK
jgi:RNA polymerase sigma factor (sigma-70 family)